MEQVTVEDQFADSLKSMANANFQAYLSDLGTEPSPVQIAKAQRDEMELDSTTAILDRFAEDCEVRRCGGTVQERLRSERPDRAADDVNKLYKRASGPGPTQEPVWRPGMDDVNIGL